MNSYTALYWFVKLDDIRSMFDNYYGTTWVIFGILGFSVGMLAITASETKEKEEKEKAWETFKNGAKKSIIVVFTAILIQMTMNAVATFLPSTGQMATIYLGGKAADSSTTEILSKLPEKYAKLLENKADEWLSQQLDEKVEVVKAVVK